MRAIWPTSWRKTSSQPRSLIAPRRHAPAKQAKAKPHHEEAAMLLLLQQDDEMICRRSLGVPVGCNGSGRAAFIPQIPSLSTPSDAALPIEPTCSDRWRMRLIRE